MIEVSATLDHLVMGLLSAYKLRNVPVDVEMPDDGILAVTFLVSKAQRWLYRRRIEAFGCELKKYLSNLYIVDIQTKQNQTWLSLI